MYFFLSPINKKEYKKGKKIVYFWVFCDCQILFLLSNYELSFQKVMFGIRLKGRTRFALIIPSQNVHYLSCKILSKNQNYELSYVEV